MLGGVTSGRAVRLMALLTIGSLPGACSGGNASSGLELKPNRFSRRVDHPLVPISTVTHTVFEGTQGVAGSGKPIHVRIVSNTLDDTRIVAGVRVAIVDVREYESGSLVEHTFDFYAQRKDGSVWYFGELVDDYKGGQVSGHGGQWLAGQEDARPGLFMPAMPRVGQSFQQERAPEVAEDRSEVVEVGLKVTTPAGTFSKCIKTKDVAPLDNVTEFKYYCPGAGLVREDVPQGRLQLVSYR